MRMMTRLILCAALIHAPLSLAAGAEKIDICSGQSQADLRACLENEAKASAAELVLAEKAAVSSLNRWDEDQRYRSTASAALQAANKSFIQFRSAQCEFASALGGGAAGNALALRRLTCLAQLNHTRAENLRKQVSALPVK